MKAIQALLEITNPDTIQQQITEFYMVDENNYVQFLLDYLPHNATQLDQQKIQVETIVTTIREKSAGGSGIDAFLQEYSLDTDEGITLMCLAEALLRIPDSETADSLIEDKLSSAEWDKHIRQSDSLFVNASTWGLMLSGKVTKLGKSSKDKPSTILGRLIDKLGEPVIRSAMYQAMKIMGKQFVLGETIKLALKEADKDREKGYTHSFDMLGEAAITMQDANLYHQSYLNAINEIGSKTYKNNVPKPSISIKLSALHPRYEESQQDRVLTELYDSVIVLINQARKLNVGVTIDAEEMDRLELSLHLFKKLFHSNETESWGDLGIVVQAYSKRSLAVLHWLNCLATEKQTRIPVRLVKGAYWDSEIKLCQQMGTDDYPVFTRKVNTDVSYIACANYLLANAKDFIYPQFATHNAQTVITIIHYAEKNKPINTIKNTAENNYEFQRLHGMGDELYSEILANNPNLNCRIYAPVGAHKALLPYLVRRLLENGANTSFVHKLVDPKTPISQLAKHPIRYAKENNSFSNPAIAKPPHIFTKRINSQGINLHIASQRNKFLEQVSSFRDKQWQAFSIINGEDKTPTSTDIDVDNTANTHSIFSPYQQSQQVGTVVFADTDIADKSVIEAKSSYKKWSNTPLTKRAEILHIIADLMEENKHELIVLCTKEAGKTLQDSIDEVREAVDFCRYYAEDAKRQWEDGVLTLVGPTGETNEIQIGGRGVFLCISPWNFPLAIFTGQIVAALVAGNAVISKPAEQTNLIAYYVIKLMHKAGVPENILHLVCGNGATIGERLVKNEQINGICFTGGTITAKHINITIANRQGAIIPFIAETGGQNCMIVDSTSLPEQVVNDVIQSAFTSAGQRCSALRVLYLQDDIADKVIELLRGAIQEQIIGNPEHYKTDIGPVIDASSQEKLNNHIQKISQNNILIAQSNLADSLLNVGSFVAPTVIEIQSIKQLAQEHFGPILHVIKFKREKLLEVVDEINSTGYGLTFGIHSRNETFYEDIAAKIDAGNIYINRNQIGATVGVNPFGGHGLSGTGPKAGGPHYLSRFINEKTISNNITAIGGNTTLLAMNSDTHL